MNEIQLPLKHLDKSKAYICGENHRIKHSFSYIYFNFVTRRWWQVYPDRGSNSLFSNKRSFSESRMLRWIINWTDQDFNIHSIERDELESFLMVRELDK